MNSKTKIVYCITENKGRKYWNRVGVAFVNVDGSINVKLDAMPVSGDMQIRDFVPKEATPAEGDSRGLSYQALA
ncbi:MAG: hypothetical protein H6718_17150 [Polyangiaceae bacterium]|nr:hypothetical protein [Myxococcales bacterium]MCB9587129.1 hypothetical protein [Polyangiaceae bacterium]MCB9609496.1 hypothetical protein [Polyangiaceae bacterium]